MAELSPDRAALAAEHALGVLSGEERAEAQRLMLADPAFARAVDEWGARLAPLGEGFAEAEVPDLWPAIAARIDGEAERATRHLRLWRGAAILSGTLAASLAAALILTPAPKPVTIVKTVARAPDQLAVAQLGGEAGALLAANYDPAQGDLRIRSLSLPASDRAPELWVIPAGGPPRSLGLVDPRGTTRVTVPARLRALLVDGATLAITMEPVAGAPHAGPSGPPVATGRISKI
jgi:anti-sigma-K factor RskA